MESSQIWRIDAQLDRLQLSRPPTPSTEDEDAVRAFDADADGSDASPRTEQLESLIQSLTPHANSTTALVSLNTVRNALQRSRISGSGTQTDAKDEDFRRESGLTLELEWLLIAKATTQVYGQFLNTILDQTIPLSDDVEYWDSILSSYRYTTLYSLQTSPLRLWDFGRDVYKEASERRTVQGIAEGAEAGWQQFYSLVKEVVRERNLADVRRKVVSPLSRVRSECRKKRDGLRRIRLINANALGVLLGEGLSNQSQQDKGWPSSTSPSAESEELEDTRDKWRTTVVKSIALMDAVVQCYTDEDVTADTFDALVESATGDDRFYKLTSPSGVGASGLKPPEVAERLETLLSTGFPSYQATYAQQVEEHGRPSWLVRYWLPTTALVLSSGTALRILVNRKAQIATWIREFGATVRDFWMNWVVEPTRKVIGTIRHDEGSEVSIMSKRSLEGDRDSLERMVVDFATQNAEGGSRNLNEAQIEEIRLKVKEGDLTPVLKAYEKDMQSPFMGVVRGNLVRALLIQIQKTKVDVEVAMGGVDSILKSQELLFG